MLKLNRILILMLWALLGAHMALADQAAVKGDVNAAAQAWPMIQQGALLIDVRSAEEFAAGHLDDALNIVHSDIDALARAIGDDPARSVVLYCRSGKRAGEALKALEARGFTGVFNASGLEALEATRP